MIPATIMTRAVMAPNARRQNPAVLSTAPKFFRYTALRSPVLAAISPRAGERCNMANFPALPGTSVSPIHGAYLWKPVGYRNCGNLGGLLEWRLPIRPVGGSTDLLRS